MAEQFELGQWVRIRGSKSAGPVRQVDNDNTLITFYDVFMGEELRVPRTILTRIEGRPLAAFGETWPRATRYEVSALRTGNPNRRNHTVYLEARPGDRWIVSNGYSDRAVMAADGSWGSLFDDDAGSDDWKARFWHSFSDASRLAADAAEETVADLPDRFRCAQGGDDDE